MDVSTAAGKFAALSQTSRLGAFRLLVQSGSEGRPAGDIARDLGIPHNTLSTHLAILARAGLVSSRRESRTVIYRIDFDGTRELLAYLVQDCCQGRPEVCAQVLDDVLPACVADAR